ncbi:GMC family oxidoreductase [Calidifontibacter sp. DB0510]|uniref:Cholesterol oxidase n=1 Tax=Metallococcus carri TaxID=1656884 RepID=A0A967B3K8_9MICO|nr:GMC family oxidoreductase [Metallococcus carri]NHN56635.1 GMC family oxidoreductase [Metallococcus carri]NOP38934.1 GMC family oxidoreductase [Calidifontibacter sp. DB2511S]
MTTVDYDVVVVGSGFGGAVSALRLAEKGYSVLVYEAGRRFEDADFAKTSWRVRSYLWAPALKCFGVQRIHKLPDVMILAGAGVGGGSLNYANTLYKPTGPFFKDPQWANITDWEEELSPHYEVASQMLGVVDNTINGPVERLMREAARDLGVEDSFRHTPVGVFFGEPGQQVPDPYFGGEGPARTGCTECGNCMVGCRVGAKNTLMKNYLALAERLGVRIEPMRTVVDLEALGDNGFRVTTETSGAWLKKDRRSVTAGQVVLAAGTWGTQTLLHTIVAQGRLPRMSDRLGVLTRTNSEALGGAAAAKVPPSMDIAKGVAITTSFHVDDTTHVENVRYGPGSNLMGLLSTLLVPGDKALPGRLGSFTVDFVKAPITNLRAAFGPRWSERTIIALVMQNLDNSITVSARKRFGKLRLTSTQGHGRPNPSWIPNGHKAIRAIAARLTEMGGVTAIPGGTWGEIFGIPLTAHFLGGAPISESPETGVIDAYHRVWGYPGLHIVDGTAVSANLGVNPSLTITAQAERAMSMWPAKGEVDERPAQGEPYRRFEPRPGRVPGLAGRVSGHTVPLGMPAVS